MNPPNSLDPTARQPPRLVTSFQRLIRSLNVDNTDPQLTNAEVQFIEDLIIHHFNSARWLNNRWAFGHENQHSEVIDYRLVSDWKEPLESYDLVRLKRIKICGLPADQMADLLANTLPPTLQQLDIDVFRVLQGSETTHYTFGSLRTLSIEAFEVVKSTTDDEVVEQTNELVELTADRLENVYLGSGTDKGISFTNPATITHLIANAPAADYLEQFSGLTHLQLNKIKNNQLFKVIKKFVRRELGRLEYLNCNVINFDHATLKFAKPTKQNPLLVDEIELLKKLKIVLFKVDQAGVRIHFNGIPAEASSEPELRKDLISSHLSHLKTIHESYQSFRCPQVTKCGLPDTRQVIDQLEIDGQKVRQSIEEVLPLLYPNIRSVIVFRYKSSTRKIDKDKLLNLISRLTFLVDLQLNNCELSDGFLDELFTRRLKDRSGLVVGTLNSFLVTVRLGTDTDLDTFYSKFDHFKFDETLLKFPRLRSFHTSVVNQKTMIAVLESTEHHPVCQLRFDFETVGGREGNLKFRWTVSKHNRTHLSNQSATSYQLIIEPKFKSFTLYNVKILRESFETLNALVDFIKKKHTSGADRIGEEPQP